MNILFVTIASLRHIEESNLYADLLKEFRDKKHSVYVICPQERRYKNGTEYNEESGIFFLRVKTLNITKTNFVEKGISTITIDHLFLHTSKKYFNNIKFDLIIHHTPPITFSKIIKYYKKRDNATDYLLLKDIFPQNALDIGIFSKKNPIYWYFRLKEKMLYKHADYIGCMSPANVHYLLSHNKNLDYNRIEVCPNSIKLSSTEVYPLKSKELKKKYGIPENKTIFIYGGNIGKPQGIDFIQKCILRNEEWSDSLILIIGNGTEFSRLVDFLHNNKIQNTIVLNHMPRRDYEDIVKISDVGLIFLDYRFTIPNFPSRILSYMQASLPILSMTDENTDLAHIISENHLGYSCINEDIECFFNCMRVLSHPELRAKLGRNARIYLEENYTIDQTYQTIMNHMREKIQSS